MALKAVFFDVGETLVDETRTWERAADASGVPRFTLMGILGGLAARGEPHRRAWAILDVEPPAERELALDFYPDALPAIEALREAGYRVGAVGNTSETVEAELRVHVDVAGSSARWGVEKPSEAFFARLVAEAACAPEELAYVGDRVDNDVLPALRAGLAAVHVRRGPWGYLHEPPAEAMRVDSLTELPDLFANA
jgi:FMN phosphatase YigB (HAD superfamily)